MSAEKVLEVMLDEATGVDDDSNVLWDSDFAEGFMKGAVFENPGLKPSCNYTPYPLWQAV